MAALNCKGTGSCNIKIYFALIRQSNETFIQHYIMYMNVNMNIMYMNIDILPPIRQKKKNTAQWKVSNNAADSI